MKLRAESAPAPALPSLSLLWPPSHPAKPPTVHLQQLHSSQTLHLQQLHLSQTRFLLLTEQSVQLTPHLCVRACVRVRTCARVRACAAAMHEKEIQQTEKLLAQADTFL